MGDDLLACSVCLDTMANAHLLPRCGHSFCLGCIESLPSPARCPLCRTACDPRQATPNFALQHMVRNMQSPEANPSASAPAGPQFTRQSTDLEVTKRAYRSLGVPSKLAAELAAEDSEIALRIYLLDNSGSMSHPDGSLLEKSGKGWRKVRGTRWQELTEMACTHGAWNASLQTPCEFVLLNSPSPSHPVEGRDVFTVSAAGDLQQQQLAALQQLKRQHPGGSTPLGARVNDIYQRVQRSLADLQRMGRKVMVTICTDGVPDSRPELVMALRRLMALPVRVVLRLCTDESSVVDFYNDLDRDLEMPLDILNDFWGEAAEVRRKNPWLVYTPVLQTIREAGTFLRVLDMIDERPLMPVEAALCAQLLVQQDGQPSYSREPMDFLKAINKDLGACQPIFDMGRQRLVPPLDFASLRAAVLPREYGGAAGLLRAVGLGSAVDWYFDLDSDAESVSDGEPKRQRQLWLCDPEH